MSSLRRHFQHFSLPKQQQHSSSAAGPHLLGLSATGKTNGINQCLVAEQAANILMADSLGKATMDVVSFKEDILNCLEICTSYIQALNTLCSTGSVLAQNLTQVFSRDLGDVGNALVPFESGYGHAGPNKLNNNVYNPFNLFGSSSKSSRHHTYPLDGRHGNAAGSRLSASNESDGTYYEVAEQFLRMWELMSVATAGASATVKTETLMTLQEVINKLESADDQAGLEKCIESAKSCLLSYIELQAQFSYNSWKALSQLSKVLKSNASMIDVVKNIKQHFAFNDAPPSNSAAAGNNGGLEASTTTTKSSSGGSSLPHGASSSNCQSRQVEPDSRDVSSLGCLQDAINLLSLDKQHNQQKKRSRKRSKRNHLHSSNRVLAQYPISASSLTPQHHHQAPDPFAQLHLPLMGGSGHVGEKAATFDGRLKSFDKRGSVRGLGDEPRLTELNMIKQSTWPGKNFGASGCGGISSNSTSNTYRLNDWSLWSDASSETTAFHTPASSTPTANSANNTLHNHHHLQSQPPHPLNQHDPFSDNFQLTWQAFAPSPAANSDQSKSTPISSNANGPVSGNSLF